MRYFAAIKDYVSTFVGMDRCHDELLSGGKNAASKAGHRVKPHLLNSDAVATEFSADPAWCPRTGMAL